jgi:Fe/S biogenesis protein NfuA
MITITDAAKGKIQELLAAEGKDGLALRFGIKGRGGGGFQYRLAFADAGDRAADDLVVDTGPFQVWIDAASVPSLQGATIDYVERPGESGFQIDNPNPLWSDPVAAAVQRLLDEEINPAVALHGGFVTLLDVRDGVAYVRLGGGCQGCGMVDVTLRQGIEVRLREVVPQIREVVDTTDHAGGANPYYQPSKGGRSPLGR